MMQYAGFYALISMAFSIGLFLWTSGLCLTGRKRASKLRSLKLWMPIVLFFAPILLPITFAYSKIEDIRLRPFEVAIFSFSIGVALGAFMVS